MSMMGNEFSGLPIADLIGGPLTAACDAQVRLAKATADFITTVGFNQDVGTDGKPTNKLVPRQVDFSYWQPMALPNEGKEVLATWSITLGGTPATGASIGNIKLGEKVILADVVQIEKDGKLETAAADVAAKINRQGSGYKASALAATITITAPPGSGASLNALSITADAKVITCTTAKLSDGKNATPEEAKVQKVVLSVPFLAIVNVPALMVKSVDTVFDMEVKSSESHHDAEDKEASLDATAKVGWGPFSAEVKIHGAISAHQENTRSTDRSAKYHVQVHASDDGMPEGLSRVLDILQKAIVPISISEPKALVDAHVAQAVR